jgi:hypothetical protein
MSQNICSFSTEVFTTAFLGWGPETDAEMVYGIDKPVTAEVSGNLRR